MFGILPVMMLKKVFKHNYCHNLKSKGFSTLTIDKKSKVQTFKLDLYESQKLANLFDLIYDFISSHFIFNLSHNFHFKIVIYCLKLFSFEIFLQNKDNLAIGYCALVIARGLFSY